MYIQKTTYIILVLLLFNYSAFSQEGKKKEKENTLTKEIELLQNYFYKKNNWFVSNPDLAKDVQGLVNFVQDEPIDSIILSIDSTFSKNDLYVFRLPENVEDSLSVSGFYAYNNVIADVEDMSIRLQTKFQNKNIVVSEYLLRDIEQKVQFVGEKEGLKLFRDSVYIIPDSLIIPEIIPDSVLNSPEQFKQLKIIDSLRNDFIEQKRVFYNDSIRKNYIDSLRNDIRKKQFETELRYQTKRIHDSVRVNNYRVLRDYNQKVVSAVNDSVFAVLKTLVDYAQFIDSTKVTIINLTGDSVDVVLHNKRERFNRVWLKNEQNDSLSVFVKNVGNKAMEMRIDDGVTFSRFKEKETKNFDFATLSRDFEKLTKVGKSYDLETPWRIGGDGTIGFTQTYLQNWKKGGQSSISSLIVLKGFANYQSKDKKTKWENSGEFRNGWIRPGSKDSEIQKNDDKFEFTSRFGVSAFKKWYYSSEFNWETQLFNGYRYPTSENPDPISAFMAPARAFFKVGLEYKPNKEFSLLLSPLTLKNVFVRDTALVDQTKFGIAADRKSFWEPGLNADIKFKKEITPDISYETKYKMFINYQQPFKKLDVNWENLLIVKLSDYINMRMMLHFIYDDDVLFPVYDENDVKIGEKPRLQIKEFLTIGFNYKINRKVMRTKRIR